MVVLYPDFLSFVKGGQPLLRMPTNKSLLATGVKLELVRQSEQSLPIEPSPYWHFFFKIFNHTNLFSLFFSSPCSFIYMIFFFGKRFICMIDT